MNNSVSAASIEAAKKLARLYRSISIEQIEKEWEANEKLTGKLFKVYGRTVANDLTGFGAPQTCLLCRAIGRDKKWLIYCTECIYSVTASRFSSPYCATGSNKWTYTSIAHAENPAELHRAFLNRANHIESILKLLERR